MRPFESLTATAAALPLPNVDTDKILPAEFLKTTNRRGLGGALFHSLRFDAIGELRDDFVLNREPWTAARILIAFENFGCGSSREHAPWALSDFGIRAIVAPSFADIFRQNCVINGILPAIVETKDARRLAQLASDPSSSTMTIDLRYCMISDALGQITSFSVDDTARAALMSGLDDIAQALAVIEVTEEHWRSRRAATPWLLDIQDLA